MQTPRKKHSPARRDTRRAHDAITVVQAATCPNCGQTVLAHTACAACGQYRGRQILKNAARE